MKERREKKCKKENTVVLIFFFTLLGKKLSVLHRNNAQAAYNKTGRILWKRFPPRALFFHF